MTATARTSLLIALLWTLTMFQDAVAGDSPWRAGYFPNVVLTDQDGRKHRFYDDLIKDRIVTINFVYTNCKDICPLDTANLLRVQDLLGDRVGKTVHMYSISIDPENDTPEALKRYREAYGVRHGWTFLTGARKDIDLLLERLAMRAPAPGKLREHDTSVRLGNEKTGQWIKRSVYDDPKVLANLLTDTLTNFDVGLAGSHETFAVAGEIKLAGRGEYLFKTRCLACHTIGAGDRLGPDLANVVAQRPRPWLARWLKEPDRMIAEGDPIALSLKARYRNLPMPNFGFGDQEVDALIDYLASVDARHRDPQALAPQTEHPRAAAP